MTQVMRASYHLLRVPASAYLRVPSTASVRTFMAATCGSKSPSPPQPCPGLTQQRRAMSKDSVRWLWPAKKDICLYDTCDKHGTRKGTLAVTFNTAQPLQPHHLTQALLHLQRRFPNLRACLRPRGETLWFCEPSQEEVNFKMVEDEADLAELCNKICEPPFTYTDPVQWRAVLVPRGDHVPCPVPEVKAAFPYQYDYIFHFHHGLGDGVDAMLILHCTVDILDDILAGRPVDEKEWCYFNDREEVRILKESVRAKLTKNPKRTNEVRSTMPSADSTPLLLEAFPKPNVTKGSTGHVNRIIEPAVMKHFQQKAREAGVSFNSSMLAAINTAIVELVKETGIVQDTYNIMAMYSIALRHYLKNKPKHPIGPYSTFLFHGSHVDHNVKNCFWDYTRKFHQELRSSLKSGLALEQDAVKQMTLPEMSPDDYFKRPQPVFYEYSATFLGVLSINKFSGSKQLKLTRVFSYNLIHSFLHSNFHQFLIFEDKCFYTLCYDRQYFSHETVNLLADKVVSVITDVAMAPGSEDSVR